MPRTDPRFLEYTPEELWLEYLEDLAEKAPEKLDELFKDAEQEAVQYVTGDASFDTVDALAAKGDFESVEKMLDSWESPKAPDKVEDVFVDEYEKK